MKLKAEALLAYLKQGGYRDIELMKTTVSFISMLLPHLNQFYATFVQ